MKQLINNNRATNTNKQIHWTYRAEGWIVTIQCLQGLTIFLITDLTIATLFSRVFVVKHQTTCYQFICFSIGLTPDLLKNHRTPQQLCCLIPNAPVQYQSSSIITMMCHKSRREITSSYYVLKGPSASSQEGSSVESTQIRWFSRWSGGGGWSGRAVAQQSQESQN